MAQWKEEVHARRTPRSAHTPHTALSACVASQMQITDDVDDDDSLELVSEVFGDTPPQLSLLAPAKVNLFLRIRGASHDEVRPRKPNIDLFDQCE